MKTLRIATLSALGLAMVVGPAFATDETYVYVTSDILKTKNIYVTEATESVKSAAISVTGVFTPEGAATAQAIANVTNSFNTVGSGTAEESADDVTAHARIADGSVVGNQGILGFNQDAGNSVNQGYNVAVSLSNVKSVADAQSWVDQRNLGNRVTSVSHDADAISPAPSKTATMIGVSGDDSSVTAHVGLLGINQNAGNMNNQTSSVALALGVGAQVALSESALGQVNSGNSVHEVGTMKTDLIEKSLNYNLGIVQVNQSSGNMNNQGSSIAISASVAQATLVPAVRGF